MPKKPEPAQPEKLDPKPLDIAADKHRQLRQLFPEVFTEGSAPDGTPAELDFEKLKQVLGDHSSLIDPDQEKYGLDWPGKSTGLQAVQTPPKGTLTACPKESVDWDSTQNLFIEGDNLVGCSLEHPPKPISLLKLLVHSVSTTLTSRDIILDFFSGSATTAHAVMALNAEDGGNRRCISVQLPEPCEPKSEAGKAGYATIADIAKERINEHLKTLYETGEIDPDPTIRKFRIVRPEGDREVARIIEHYSLDAILAVGYRVRSVRGIQFRRWASERLSEYLVKGFTMDDERLKNPPSKNSDVPDYFDELLERIRDIRSSEQRVYLRVREIFSLAADYVPSARETTRLFPFMPRLYIVTP